MPWLPISKGPDAGREYWKPIVSGDWPLDERVPEAPFALREPLPAPCPTCGGRLVRWVASDEGAVDYRHTRALARWRALSSQGPAPERELVQTWVTYRFAHFTDCRPIPALDVAGAIHGSVLTLTPAPRVRGDL